MNFLIGKVLQVLYFPSNAAVKTENLKEEFLRSFFSNLCFQSLRTMAQFVGNESRLKKFTEVNFNYNFSLHKRDKSQCKFWRIECLDQNH